MSIEVGSLKESVSAVDHLSISSGNSDEEREEIPEDSPMMSDVEDQPEPLGSTSGLQRFCRRTFPSQDSEQGIGTLTLDPIKKELIGKLAASALLKASQKLIGPEWTNELLEIFECSSVEHWCGRKAATDDEPKILVTQGKFTDAVKTLSEGVLERVDKRHFFNCDPRCRSYVTIFLVPKDTEKARAIGNCKTMNQQFKKSPRLTFAMMDDLFRLVTFFGWRSFFATADFRHWFYQIPLPKAARRFFTVKCGRMIRQFTVWPMGFAWSPFVAQGISMLLAWLAVWNCGNLEAVSPMESQ